MNWVIAGVFGTFFLFAALIMPLFYLVAFFCDNRDPLHEVYQLYKAAIIFLLAVFLIWTALS